MSKIVEHREQIGWTLVLASRLYRRVIDREVAGFGVSQTALTPLRYLARNSAPLRQGGLAEALGIKGPTLVSVLDQLERQSLVRRMEDVVDRRARLIEITAEGRELVNRIETRLADVRALLFDGITAEHLESCDTVLTILSDNLRQMKSSTPAILS